MTLSIQRNGVPLDQLYGTKGSSTAGATGCLQNGTDVNQYLMALADGKPLGFNSGLTKNGTDFSSIFGIPQTSLPINGQTFSASATASEPIGGGVKTCTANVSFSVSTSSGWSITPSAHTNSGTTNVTNPMSGSLPNGSVSVSYGWSASVSDTRTSVTNGASSSTSISSSPSFVIASQSTSAQNEATISGSLTIEFYNSSGSVISTTTVKVSADTTGST